MKKICIIIFILFVIKPGYSMLLKKEAINKARQNGLTDTDIILFIKKNRPEYIKDLRKRTQNALNNGLDYENIKKYLNETFDINISPLIEDLKPTKNALKKTTKSDNFFIFKSDLPQIHNTLDKIAWYKETPSVEKIKVTSTSYIFLVERSQYSKSALRFSKIIAYNKNQRCHIDVSYSTDYTIIESKGNYNYLFDEGYYKKPKPILNAMEFGEHDYFYIFIKVPRTCTKIVFKDYQELGNDGVITINEKRFLTYLPDSLKNKKVNEITFAKEQKKEKIKNDFIDKTPPEIIILSPAQQRGVFITSKSYCTIIGIAKDQSEIITVIVNDKEVELQKISGGVKFSAKVSLTTYENFVNISASDKYGNIGKKILTLRRREQHISETSDTKKIQSIKPELWILSIGISNYKNSSMNLKYADNDAEKIAEIFSKQKNTLFSKIHYKTLLNEKVTRNNIIKNIAGFLGQASYNDIVIIFVAGHGVKHKQTGSYYFLTYDSEMDSLLTNGLRWSDFSESINILKKNVSKVLLFIDSCHAGAMKIAMREVESGEDLADALAKAEGIFLLSASKAGEQSAESILYKISDEDVKGHGAFTFAILNGLNGKADFNNDKIINISELFGYVAKSVPKITQGNQHPYFRSIGTDMPIYRK